MAEPIRIRRLAPDEPGTAAAGLAHVLVDCVAGGASVSFMADLSFAAARAFWREALSSPDGRSVLAAEDEAGIVGVVQVVPAGPQNQPHRADISKLLVHRRGRGRRVGEALMRAAEAEARAMGKTLLVLDTVRGGKAEDLYQRLGWVRVGEIPNYALMPDGEPCATVIFYKELAA